MSQGVFVGGEVFGDEVDLEKMGRAQKSVLLNFSERVVELHSLKVFNTGFAERDIGNQPHGEVDY